MKKAEQDKVKARISKQQWINTPSMRVCQCQCKLVANTEATTSDISHLPVFSSLHINNVLCLLRFFLKILVSVCKHWKTKDDIYTVQKAFFRKLCKIQDDIFIPLFWQCTFYVYIFTQTHICVYIHFYLCCPYVLRQKCRLLGLLGLCSRLLVGASILFMSEGLTLTQKRGWWRKRHWEPDSWHSEGSRPCWKLLHFMQ